MARIYNWLLYDVAFALLPVFAAWVFSNMARRAVAERGGVEPFNSDLPEVLFFVIVLNVTAVRDIQKVTEPPHLKNTFSVLTSSQLLCAVASSILYGGVRFLRVINPEASVADLMTLSIGIAVIFFFVAALTQILITKVEEQKEG